MVTNEERQIFVECYRLIEKYSNISLEVEEWARFVQDMAGITENHKDELASDITIAIMRYLERKIKNVSNQKN